MVPKAIPPLYHPNECLLRQAAQHAHAARPADSARFYEVCGIPTLSRFRTVSAGG